MLKKSDQILTDEQEAASQAGAGGKRGESSNENSTVSYDILSAFLENSSNNEDSDNEEETVEDTEGVDVTPGFSTQEDFDQAVQNIVEGQVVGSWIEFWAWVMGEAGEDFISNIDKLKSKLLALIDIIEKSIKILKTLVDAAFAIAGMLLEMSSVAIALAKALLTFLKSLLEVIVGLFEIPLLKAEAKMATFELFTGLDTKDMDLMGPKVQEMLNDMTSTWMNRPVANDTACALVFLPIAIPKEAAEAISYSVKFKDLLLKLFEDRKDLEEETPTGSTPGDANSLADVLMDLSNNYVPLIALTPGVKAEHYYAMDLADQIAESVDDNMYRKLIDQYSLITGTEEFIANRAFSEDSSTQTNIIPGIVEYRARENIREMGDCIFETSFRNNKYKYLSAIYKVAQTDGVIEVTQLFSDPVFKVFKAVMNSPTLLGYAKSYTNILLSYRQWRLQVKGWKLKIRDEEQALMRKMDSLMEDMFGDSWEDLVRRYSPPSDKIILFVMVGNALNKAKAKGGFDPLKDYKKQIKKITGVEYSTRSTVELNQPLFPNTIEIKEVKSEDRLVFFFEDANCPYPSVDFITDGVNGITASGSLISADRLTPGDLSAYENTIVATTTVLPATADGITPRWYGWGTPPGVNSWTSSKLIQTVMPEKASRAIDGFFGMVDDIDELLDEWSENVSDAKKKLAAYKEYIDRYFRLAQKIIDKVKALIESLSLTQLPTVYTAIWRGGPEDIPGILTTALNEKQWLNSTYGGIIVFMTGSAVELAAKGYVAYLDEATKFESLQEQLLATKDSSPSWSDIKDTAKGAKEDMDALADSIEKDVSVIKGDLFVDLRDFGSLQLGSISSESDAKEVAKQILQLSEVSYARVSSRAQSIVVESTDVYNKPPENN